MLPYGEIPKRMVPKMYRSHKWAQMVLLLEKVEKGEMSVEEYRRIIGWRAATTAGTAQQSIMGGGADYTRTLTWDAATDVSLPNPKILFETQRDRLRSVKPFVKITLRFFSKQF